MQAEAASPLVRLEKVSKKFSNGTIALDGFDLELARGDFLSLLGPSGCGKSTALRLIAGLSGATGGHINWAAQDQGQARPEIGFVFQEPTLMPWATLAENVYLPLRLKGRSRASCRDEVAQALDLVDLAQFANSYPRELSGGMKMRASIARAIVVKPKLLLMDEPFAALDEITRFKLNNDLLHLWQRLGWTVIFVTHSVFESVYLSNRILVMAARPGRKIDEIDIGAAYPRGDDFRVSSEYSTYCREASALLARAMDMGGIDLGNPT
ncbi:MAG: ABC transporter ATP-binding protein [Alphaproteobacteria bacterium]